MGHVSRLRPKLVPQSRPQSLRCNRRQSKTGTTKSWFRFDCACVEMAAAFENFHNLCFSSQDRICLKERQLSKRRLSCKEETLFQSFFAMRNIAHCRGSAGRLIDGICDFAGSESNHVQWVPARKFCSDRETTEISQ